MPSPHHSSPRPTPITSRRATCWAVEAANANSSTTPTFTPDGLTTYTIEKAGGQALVAGDIYGAGHCALFMLSAANKVELLNPAMLRDSGGRPSP
jgi:hypothetical protein